MKTICKRLMILLGIISSNALNGGISVSYNNDALFADTIAPVLNCADQMFEVDGNCQRVVELKKSATDAGECVDGGWLKWEVYVDLWADGSQDLLYSSFYAGPQGAVRTITINGVAHAVRQYTLSPTTSGSEAKLTLPEPVEGSMSNHKVLWKVTDGCQNWVTCHETFHVEDKKPPTPVCNNWIDVRLQDPDGSGPLKPMAELWAIDFMNRSYDNCTNESDLMYTFDGWAPQVILKNDGAGNPMSIDHPHFFNANGGVASAVNPNASEYKAALTQYQLGNLQLWIPSTRSSAKVWKSDNYVFASMKEVDVKVTVWDTRFNSDYCWTTFTPTGCDGSPPRAYGKVSTYFGKPVNNVSIHANTGLNAVSDSIYSFTKHSGDYHLILKPCTTYSITASKTGDFLNGVSTLDLILIQRHILGLQKIDNPYMRIAADVTNDGDISASDIIELRSLIMGTATYFTSNKSWRFVPKTFKVDPENPFTFEDKITYPIFGPGFSYPDFTAVKIGDVNGNVTTNVADPMTESRSNKSVVMAVAGQAVAAGDVVYVPVTAANFNEVMGYQFTMKLNGARFLGIEAGAINADASNVGVLANGMITMSFGSSEAVSVNEGTVLFTLILNADKAANVSEMIAVTSDVTAAESYNANLEVGKVSLDVRTAPVASIELFQNEPNPFRGQTTVTFNMPVDARAILSICDVTGKVVTVRNIDAMKGMNTEIFTREQLGTSGMLYYTLKSVGFTTTRKMTVVE